MGNNRLWVRVRCSVTYIPTQLVKGDSNVKAASDNGVPEPSRPSPFLLIDSAASAPRGRLQELTIT